MERAVERELWTSWSSLLRAYSAAHGLSSSHHAVVEVGAEEIILRVDTRWTRFTRSEMTTGEGASRSFAIEVDGKVRISGEAEEMDIAAEEITRRMLTAG